MMHRNITPESAIVPVDILWVPGLEVEDSMNHTFRLIGRGVLSTGGALITPDINTDEPELALPKYQHTGYDEAMQTNVPLSLDVPHGIGTTNPVREVVALEDALRTNEVILPVSHRSLKASLLRGGRKNIGIVSPDAHSKDVAKILSHLLGHYLGGIVRYPVPGHGRMSNRLRATMHHSLYRVATTRSGRNPESLEMMAQKYDTIAAKLGRESVRDIQPQ